MIAFRDVPSDDFCHLQAFAEIGKSENAQVNSITDRTAFRIRPVEGM